MSFSRLESLPNEIICEILDYVNQSHRPTITALCLVSKQIHSCAVIFQFRTITISVQTGDRLKRDVNRLPARVADQVRHLIISGYLRRPQPIASESSDDAFVQEFEEVFRRQNQPPSTSDFMVALDSSFRLRNRTLSILHQQPSIPLSAIHEDDRHWLPLAKLIERLPLLSDILYTCVNPFSPCLLKAVHSRSSRCRLHIEMFGFLSLDEPVLDAHELALATSPCLHSIAIGFSWVGTNGKPQYYVGAIRDVIRDLAPNLKDVYMYNANYGQTQIAVDMGLMEGSKDIWSGLNLDQSPRKQGTSTMKGSLRSLRLAGDCSFSSKDHWIWDKVTDMSLLSELEFEQVDTAALEYLATKCRFTSLKTLKFGLISMQKFRDQLGSYPEGLIKHEEAGCAFLRSLPPLKSLTYSGELRLSTFDAIIEHHGTLKELSLNTTAYFNEFLLKSAEIDRLRQSCPRIEKLRVRVPRTLGNMDEVSIYKSLGSFIWLRELSLDLSCSNVTFGVRWDESSDVIPNDPTFDEWEQIILNPGNGQNYFQYRNGHLRRAYINSALDENLASSIFDTISASKPPDAPLIQKFEVHTTGGNSFEARGASISFFTGTSNVIDEISGSWLFMRNPRDDRRNEMLIKNMKWRQRPNKSRIAREAAKIFQRIWPAKDEGGSSWRKDWYSFPLATNNTKI